jgi:hypothetical protein
VTCAVGGFRPARRRSSGLVLRGDATGIFAVSVVRRSRRADQRRVRLSSSHGHPLIFCIAGLDDIAADHRIVATLNLHKLVIRRCRRCDMS